MRPISFACAAMLVASHIPIATAQPQSQQVSKQEFLAAATEIARRVKQADSWRTLTITANCQVTFTSKWDHQRTTMNLKNADPTRSNVEGQFLTLTCSDSKKCVNRKFSGRTVLSEQLETRIAGKIETNSTLLATTMRFCGASGTSN